MFESASEYRLGVKLNCRNQTLNDEAQMTRSVIFHSAFLFEYTAGQLQDRSYDLSTYLYETVCDDIWMRRASKRHARVHRRKLIPQLPRSYLLKLECQSSS